MPNTLAHIGIQGIITRSIIKNADYKWILIGCVIPDAPWILQRIVRFFFEVNPYDLRLYSTVQSSLFFCIILSFFIATFAKKYWHAFALLSFNALLHLLIDALQTKWANGIHLLAPLDWRHINFGLFWPESIITYTLAAYGFIYFLIRWPDCFKSKSKLRLRSIPLIATLSLYLLLPLLFLSGPEKADNHFVKTLRMTEERRGKYIEVDRGKHLISNNTHYIKVYTGEEIEIEKIGTNNFNYISIQGTFIDNKLISVSNYHKHNVGFRDIASYMGLILVGLYLICNTCSQRWINFKNRS